MNNREQKLDLNVVDLALGDKEIMSVFVDTGAKKMKASWKAFLLFPFDVSLSVFQR